MGYFHSDPHTHLGGLSTCESPHHDSNLNPRTIRKAIIRWFKSMWLDILFLCIAAAYGYIIFHHKTPFVTRLFPVTFPNSDFDNANRIVYPSLAYPQRTELFPTFYTTLVSFGIPILVLCALQLWIRSFWDWNNAVLGLLYAAIGGSCFQVTIKMFIGGLRPHFLDVCQPVTPNREFFGQGYQNMMFDRTICTGDPSEIDDALTSFPSGHATAALAGFLYLALYINGKIKPFTSVRTPFWKILAISTPVLLAVLLAASKTVDEYHHWYDVLVGGIIGAVFAVMSYRCVFAGVWDAGVNQVPLVGEGWEEGDWSAPSPVRSMGST